MPRISTTFHGIRGATPDRPPRQRRCVSWPSATLVTLRIRMDTLRLQEVAVSERIGSGWLDGGPCRSTFQRKLLAGVRPRLVDVTR
jgi:hypothetical protein